jgi:hypothetical protein
MSRKHNSAAASVSVPASAPAAEAPDLDLDIDDSDAEPAEDSDSNRKRTRVKLRHPSSKSWVRMFADLAFESGFEVGLGKFVSGTRSAEWPHSSDGRPFVQVNGRGETAQDWALRMAERARIKALPPEARKAIRKAKSDAKEAARAVEIQRLMAEEGLTLLEAMARTAK